MPRLELSVTLIPYLTFWLVRFLDRSEWPIALSGCIYSRKISSSSTCGADPYICQSEEFRFVPPVIPRTSSGLRGCRPPTYSGFDCGQAHCEFSWTLGVTCRLLNTSDFPAHMIVICSACRLTPCIVLWHSSWLNYRICPRNHTSAPVT
jgi:hypothetical protein